METQEGSIKHVWKFALPLIIAQASYTMMQFMGRLFLSWYGTDELAASTPSAVLNFLMICFFVGVASYSNVFIAQYFGRKNFEKLTLSLWQGVFFALGSALLILLTIPLGLYLLQFSTQDPHILSLERDYYLIAAPAGIFGILNAALSGFFTGRGKTKVTMITNFLGNIVNMIVCYSLVFGLGPLDPQGIKGTAYALVLGNAFITITYLSIIFSKKNREEFSTMKLFRFEKNLFLRLLKYGIPSGVSFFLDISAFSAFIFIVGNLGKTALAANNLVLSLESISFLPILGIGIATSTLVGQMIGRGRHDLAIRATYSALILNLLYTGTLALAFFFLPDFFISFFSLKNPEGMREIALQAHSLLKILAFFIVADAVCLTFGSAIKGAGDTKFQMIMSVLSAWIFYVPSVYFFCHILGKPIEWAWIISALHLGILGLVFTLRFRSNRWQKIDIIEKDKEDPPSDDSEGEISLVLEGREPAT